MSSAPPEGGDKPRARSARRRRRAKRHEAPLDPDLDAEESSDDGATPAANGASEGADAARRPTKVNTLVGRLGPLYLEVDPRSLALFRILFGLLLLADLARHVRAIPVWFTDDAVVPPSWILRIEGGKTPLSIFLLEAHAPFVALVFAAFFAIFVAFTVGYRTRLAHLLAIAAVVSLHGRDDFIEHAGERSIHVFLIFTAFLPLGRRYAIDALRAGAPSEPKPVRSVAYLGILLQFAVIYLLDWAVKSGSAWREGTALVGAIEPMTGTRLGIVLRDAAPRALFRLLGTGTLVAELSASMLVLMPSHALRLASAALMVGLHLGIWIFMSLGVFQPTMIAAAALLVSPGAWAWLEASPALEPLRDKLRAVGDRVTVAVSHHLAPAHRPRFDGTELRETMAAAFTLVMGVLVLGGNDKLIPPAFRPSIAPTLARGFFRVGVFQTWDHYANPPMEDGMLVVDAVTSNGRHVDPVNESAIRHKGPPLKEVPHEMPMSLFWWNFEKYTHSERSELLRPLGEWILRYSNRTGRADDRILSYEIAWIVTVRSEEGRPVRTRRLHLASFPEGARQPEPDRLGE